MRTTDKIRIGTRGSRLALAQTKIVVDSLMSAHGDLEIQVVKVRTRGDVLPPSRKMGEDGKSAFTGALEDGLSRGDIDAAVHSMKDLPGELGKGLAIAAVPARGDPRDAFVSSNGMRLNEMRVGARIGTSSVRRKAQLLAIRRDLVMVEIHGNVETRLDRVGKEGLDGVVLAAAGLQRLGLDERVTHYFEPNEVVPAACQGTLAVEARESETELLGLLGALDDPSARAESECEREFSRKLGGDCYVPLGAHAVASEGVIRAVGVVASIDGTRVVRAEESGPSSTGTQIGSRLGERVLASGGREILEELSA